MATAYPNGIDEFTNPLPTDRQSAEVGGRTHSEMHADANDAIEAIEAELGTNPSGDHDTVADRIDAVEQAAAAVENYVHIQNSNSAEWVVTHNLEMFPNVTVLEIGGANVEGTIQYLTANQLRITFSVPISGYAYLS